MNLSDRQRYVDGLWISGLIQSGVLTLEESVSGTSYRQSHHHVRPPHRRTPRHPRPRSPNDPQDRRLGRTPPLREPRGRTPGIPRLHLRPTRRPRTRTRKSFKEAILAGRLAAALKRLNPWLSETNIVTAIKAVTQVPATSLAEANERLYTSLTYGIALEQDRGDGRKSHTVRFLDFDNPDNNEWIVTRQYRVLGSKKHVIPDIVIFVNGLPLAIIECKSPTKGDGWKSEAVQQLHRYQELGTRWKGQGAPKLFEAAQILVGTCGERAVYGTVGTAERFFLEWKEPYPLGPKQFEYQLGRPPTPQDILLYGLLERRNLLDIIRNFVVFEIESGRTARKLTRYRQFIAVNQAMGRIRTANKPSARGGIVWHTQGSGKSLTMLWLALKLRRDPSQQQPTIVIVTDRTKLDKQIAGVFTACGFPNPERADSVRHLRRILEHPTGKTVMTTIQKFQDITGANAVPRNQSVHPTLSEGHQHLRHGGRSPPDAVPEPRREHAAGAAERLLSRLHRHADRQEGPQHPPGLRSLHRHLHHRAGGP